MQINWQDVTLSSSPEKESVEDFFNSQIASYLNDNSSLGLDGNAVLDKCINIVISLLKNEIIKSCKGVRLENDNGNYTFYFECVMPQQADVISIGVNLEVGE